MLLVKLWIEEVTNRVEVIRSGKVSPIDGEEVFAEIRERLTKWNTDFF